MWPSVVAAFAAPGFFLLFATAGRSGDLVLSTNALLGLQRLGICVLIISVSMRLLISPPKFVRRIIQRRHDS